MSCAEERYPACPIELVNLVSLSDCLAATSGHAGSYLDLGYLFFAPREWDRVLVGTSLVGPSLHRRVDNRSHGISRIEQLHVAERIK